MSSAAATKRSNGLRLTIAAGSVSANRAALSSVISLTIDARHERRTMDKVDGHVLLGWVRVDVRSIGMNEHGVPRMGKNRVPRLWLITEDPG